MPLSPGTALQNGHYVIDALLEAAPNGDLYWGTHIVSGVQVYLQVTPLAATVNPAELSAFIARLQGVAFAPQSPLPQPLEIFQGEAGELGLAIGTPMGQPWTHAYRTQGALSPKAALKTIRQVATQVIWLATQELTAIDLSPNRIWLAPDSDRVVLSGLPQPYLATANPESAPTPPPRFFARLLYSFLLGELPPDTDSQTLAKTLQERLPQISPLIVQAIHQGDAIASPEDSVPVATNQWLALLPDVAPIPARATPSTQLVPRPPQATPRQHQPTIPLALGVTSLVAAIAGVTLGTAWRLSAGNLPGAIQLDPNQSFPPLAEWAGNNPEAAFEAPFLPAEPMGERQEDWLDSDWEVDADSPAESWIPAESSAWPQAPTSLTDPPEEWEPLAPETVEELPATEAADLETNEFSDRESPQAEPPVADPEPESAEPPASTEKGFSNAPTAGDSGAAAADTELAPMGVPDP